MQPDITLFYTPNTRATGVRILLEELAAPFHLYLLNFKKEEHLKPEYLAINPMGKVPAIKDGDTLITEQVAIFIYLADIFPQKGLAPKIGDPLRGAYLRWLVYHGSCFEPAVVDKHLGLATDQRAMVPYGSYDLMVDTLNNQLAKGPYLLGEQFTAADLLWGTALQWTIGYKLVPALPAFTDYVARIISRPSVQKIKEDDQKLSAQMAAEAAV